MKQTSITNTDTSVQNAQDAVNASLAKFETALEHLADKVEAASHRVEHVGELARKSKDELLHFKESFQHSIEPFVPYIQQGKEVSQRAITKVQQNPKPYLLTAAGVFAGLLMLQFLQRKPQRTLRTQYQPDYEPLTSF